MHCVYVYKRFRTLSVTFEFLEGRKTAFNISNLKGQWSDAPIPEPEEA